MSEVFQVDSRCSKKVSLDRLLHKNTVYDINSYNDIQCNNNIQYKTKQCNAMQYKTIQ